MRVIASIKLAFAMFTAIPVKNADWSEQSMRYMLCAFPLVGAVMIPLLAGWFWLCGVLGVGKLLFAAGVTLLPVAVTGGIHLDGFADTADALASHASVEKKRAILKDPHAGAFAVIGVGSYLLCYFALASELATAMCAALLVGLTHVLSRVASGLCALLFAGSGAGGSLETFRESASKKRAVAALAAEGALTAAIMIYLDPWPASAACAAVLLCALLLRRTAKREFGGMSGDLSGWFLQTAELAMLAAIIFTQAAQRVVNGGQI